MIGYIFETTNTKTGKTYLGKRYAVSFDKNYLGEVDSDELAKDIEQYGRPTFAVKMLMPFEDPAKLENALAEMSKKSVKTAVEPEEDKKPGRKKKAVEEE